MTKVNETRDIQALAFGINANAQALMQSGVATASAATSLTTNSGTTHATNDLAGQIVVANTNATWASGTVVYGLIQSNTSGTNTIVTVDRWYSLVTPGGAAATTPASTSNYVILPCAPPFWFMGLSTNATAVTGTDTAVNIASEVTSTGLKRKICPLAHTAGATTATLTPVFTASGDSYPVVVAKILVTNSIVAAKGFAYFITVLSATATVNQDGDTLTVTETITVG